MGLSKLIALKIVSNPRDLLFQIIRVGNTFGWAICYGPSRDCRTILSHAIALPSREAALSSMQEVLADCSSVIASEITNPETMIGGCLNPDRLPVEELDFLDERALSEVMARLASSDSVETYPATAYGS